MYESVRLYRRVQYNASEVAHRAGPSAAADTCHIYAKHFVVDLAANETNKRISTTTFVTTFLQLYK